MRISEKRSLPFRTRLLSGLMAVLMAVSLLPASLVPAKAASWMEPYLEKLVSWGVMRGDSSGNLHPDRDITRAEFVVLMNRAFGYDKTGSIPFTDVNYSDWYYDDVCIAYNTGYFNGTSASTASPRANVTREQATVLLGRSLMLDNDPGAISDFSDSNSIGTWSRGIIHSAVNEGIVSGYSDGSFQPKKNITRGQMAVLLVNAIGTPINTSGTHTLGGVYGNVTISTTDVTLKDTTIAGNLYISGGLGLGNVNLENVNVLGKIVVSGAGESHAGENSIQLRNVTAPTMIMDSLANQFVTIRADGDTKIDSTSVRTSAYLEDATDDDHGLAKIRLEGENGTQLDLAGNIKEVTNLTPQSSVRVTKGTTKVLTVDEKATGSTVDVARNAVTNTLNLDVGTSVTGAGDVTNMNINASGSSSAMLPDTVTVRPGIDANISGSKMDTTLAAESSAEPRLLSSYPKITNLNPTTATALFRTNKAGTIYWALTSITDGSVNEEALMNPVSRANIVRSGNIRATASNTDYTAALSGLTSDGSYYVSAMLVDSRGQKSPVKVVSFTTPDNSVPNFASGYPYMSKILNTTAQTAVMTTKTCRLYYAVLPRGGTAPTQQDFRSGAVPGNYGFGTLDMVKNEPRLFYVNSKPLEELANYDLYLWLTDEDGAHSSAIRRVSFTTVDKTPPEFVTQPTVTAIQATSVTMNASINENGTIYWVAVKEGDEYPKPINGQTIKPSLSSDAAKLQVANGMNGLRSGRVTATANRDVKINVSGLGKEASYDVYYLIQDRAGNYSTTVGKITVHTLDTSPPTVRQEFTSTNDSEGKSPLANTDVKIIFSENVQDIGSGKKLIDLYQRSKDMTLTAAERTDAGVELESILRNNIQLYDASVTPAVLVADKSKVAATDPWVINYTDVVLEMQEGELVLTFKYGEGGGGNLHLASGGRYFFRISGIQDTSERKNRINPNPTTLETFTVVFANLNLAATDSFCNAETTDADGHIDTTAKQVVFDMSFKVVPESTASVSGDIYWDLLFRTTSTVEFALYEKIGDSGTWELVKNDAKTSAKTAGLVGRDGELLGISHSYRFHTEPGAALTNFGKLKDVTSPRHYGIVFTKFNGNDQRGTWNGRVEMEVRAIAGSNYSVMANLAGRTFTTSDLNTAISGGVVEVSTFGTDSYYTMRKDFSDLLAPRFQTNYPDFSGILDVQGNMNVQLDRSSGTIYYVIAPLGEIGTSVQYLKTDGTAENAVTLTEKEYADLRTTANIKVDEDGNPQPATGDSLAPVYCTAPTSIEVMQPVYSSTRVISGHVPYTGSTASIPIPTGDSVMEPSTKYVAYFVLQGDSTDVYSRPYIFQFQTMDLIRPIITLNISNPSVSVGSNLTTDVDWLLAVNGQEPPEFRYLMSGSSTNNTPNYLDTTMMASADFKVKYPDAVTSKADFDTKYGSNFTVLDAMSTDFRDAAGTLLGSVFDIYASQDAKDDFANLIRSSVPSAGAIMHIDSTQVTAGTRVSVNCSPWMTGTVWHTFIAVGKSMAGSSDAFRSTRPVFNIGGSKPMVTSCIIDDYTDYPSGPRDPLTATVTVSFNTILHWYISDGTDSSQPFIEATNASWDPANPNKYYPASLAFSPSGSAITLVTGTAGQQIDSVKFKLTAARPGASITGSYFICDSLGNRHENGPNNGVNLVMTLRYRRVDEDDGTGKTTTYYDPYFEITKEWDGRPQSN